MESWKTPLDVIEEISVFSMLASEDTQCIYQRQVCWFTKKVLPGNHDMQRFPPWVWEQDIQAREISLLCHFRMNTARTLLMARIVSKLAKTTTFQEARDAQFVSSAILRMWFIMSRIFNSKQRTQVVERNCIPLNQEDRKWEDIARRQVFLCITGINGFANKVQQASYCTSKCYTHLSFESI